MKNLNPLYESSGAEPLIAPDAPRTTASIVFGPFGALAYDTAERHGITPGGILKRTGRGVKFVSRKAWSGAKNLKYRIQQRREMKRQQMEQPPLPEQNSNTEPILQ